MRSKSDKKLIFSLACTYPLNYVNTDSRKRTAVPAIIPVIYCCLNISWPPVTAFWRRCKLRALLLPKAELCSGSVTCCTSSPSMYLLPEVCYRIPLKSVLPTSTPGGKPGSFAFFLPTFPFWWPVSWQGNRGRNKPGVWRFASQCGKLPEAQTWLECFNENSDWKNQSSTSVHLKRSTFENSALFRIMPLLVSKRRLNGF